MGTKLACCTGAPAVSEESIEGSERMRHHEGQELEPPHQITGRGYGEASARFRGRLGWVGKQAGGKGQETEEKHPPAVALIEEEESGFVRVRRKSWARLIAKVYLEDPELCARCGGRMKVVAAISSPAHDAVIEKVLRARGGWDRVLIPEEIRATFAAR